MPDDGTHLDTFRFEPGPPGGEDGRPPPLPTRKAPPRDQIGLYSAGPPRDEDGHALILVDGQIYTIVEGDLIVDDDEKRIWHDADASRGRALRGVPKEPPEPNQLIGLTEGGRTVRWAPGTILTYAVLQNTFSREEWYLEVVENMRLATRAWEDTCGVRFSHRQDLDGSPSTGASGVVFSVRHISAAGAFIAAAFFPNDPPQRRRVLIDPSYYRTRFDRVGVLRHELGHVLGFRHEHIRSGAPPACPDESLTNTVELTDYDPRSVMHYFCGGVGSPALEITEVDRAGSQQLYGSPLSVYEFVH